MAADPTRHDTDSPPDESSNSSPSLLASASGPPRPPRPAKRSSSSRIPIPMPAPRDPESIDGESLDAAPSRSVHDEGERPSAPFPLTAARVTTPVPAASPDDFDRDGAFGSDRAPAAPLTPWNNVPPLRLPQADTDSSPPVGIDALDEPEDTIVGEVPKNLLELSSAGDENTRAYTAPQELIELARRKREERQQARGGASAAPPRVESAAPPVPDPTSVVTERPPKMRKRDEAAKQAQSSRMAPTTPVAPSPTKATPVPSPARAGVPSPRGAAPVIDSVPPLSDDDSAPPVNRSFVPERSRSGRPAGSAPRLEVSPASDLDPGSIPSASEVMPRREPESVASVSKYKTPWLTGVRRWAVVIGVFIVLGYAISRWRMFFLP